MLWWTQDAGPFATRETTTLLLVISDREVVGKSEAREKLTVNGMPAHVVLWIPYDVDVDSY